MVADGGPDDGLPQARDRMAPVRGSGTWGSTLATGEFLLAGLCHNLLLLSRLS